VSTLEPDVLPKTVFAFRPPEVIIPCSKSAKLRLRLLRKYNQPPPNNANNPRPPPTKGKSNSSNMLDSAIGSGVTTGFGATFSSGFVTVDGGAGVSTATASVGT